MGSDWLCWSLVSLIGTSLILLAKNTQLLAKLYSLFANDLVQRMVEDERLHCKASKLEVNPLGTPVTEGKDKPTL